jgi:hypothetical protein
MMNDPSSSFSSRRSNHDAPGAGNPLVLTAQSADWIWGKDWGKKAHGFQPISISRKPLETVPHIAQQDAWFGLIIGPSLWEL